MTLFFIGLVVLTLLTLLIFVPFTNRIDWHKNHRQQQNIALYRQQTATQLNAELADEFSQRLLNDEKQLQNQPHFSALDKSTAGFSAKIATVLLIILLALPIAYYFSLDRFEHALQSEKTLTEIQQQWENATSVEKNDDYILSIQNKLRKEPNDGETWLVLGQAYMLSNEFENALLAYSYAEGLLGSQPHILGLAATALYYQAGQKITPRVQMLIDNALRQDPQEVSSLSLLASDAFLTTRYAKALQLWQQILDSERQSIERRSIIQSMQMAEKLQKAQQK